jgi:Esterase-like activity of phytase
MKQHTLTVPALLITGGLLTACGGGQQDSLPTPAPVSGVFLDSAVSGLDYVSGISAKASTGADGSFQCKTGDLMTFTLGNMNFGSTICAKAITPLTLSLASQVKDDRVVNRLLALQLLDEDNDPANGIQLNSSVKTTLATQTLDFSASAANFNSAMNALLAKLPPAYQSRSADTEHRNLAVEHFEDTLAARLNTPAVETVTQTNRLGSISAAITRYRVAAATSFYVPYEGSVATVRADFPKGFLPAYGSGLSFKGKATDGSLEFYGITDRGPNADGPKVGNDVITPGASGSSDAKFFPAPGFTPSIGVISVGTGGAVLKSSMPIRVSADIKANGLPLPAGKTGASGEVPLTDAAKYEAGSKTIFSEHGIDPESVVLDSARGVFWVSDEYGPFIMKIDINSGIILKKYQPGTGAADLPAVLLKRRANRGMEGLTLDVVSGKVHGFIQSPLDDGKAAYKVPGASAASNESIKDYASFNRWIEFDPATEKSRLFAYPLDSTQYASGKTGSAKLGDMVSIGGGKFVVIEQGAGADGKVFNHLMLVQVPDGVTDIAAMNSDLEKSSMTGAAVNGVNYQNVLTLKKTLLLDLNAAGWMAEKAEGLALVDDSTLALINDNDFGVRTLVQTAEGKEVAGADITKCTVDAKGVLKASSGIGCAPANSARATRGTDAERPYRLWLLKFDKRLAQLLVP